MLDPSPAPATTPPVVNQGYEYQEVCAQLGGQPTPPYFAVHRADGTIVGLCLGLAWNPRAEADPAEVWVGRKGDLPKWGAKLAETTGPLPVYVRREQRGKWFFTGRFEVAGTSTEPEALRQRLNPPSITGISRIVFLRRSSGHEPPVPADQPPLSSSPA